MMKCEALKPIHHHKTMTILIHFLVHRWHCSFTVAGRRGPRAQSMTSSFSSSHNQKLANKIPTEFFAPQHHPNHLVLILEQDGRKKFEKSPTHAQIVHQNGIANEEWDYVTCCFGLSFIHLGLEVWKKYEKYYKL